MPPRIQIAKCVQTKDSRMSIEYTYTQSYISQQPLDHLSNQA